MPESPRSMTTIVMLTGRLCNYLFTLFAPPFIPLTHPLTSGLAMCGILQLMVCEGTFIFHI